MKMSLYEFICYVNNNPDWVINSNFEYSPNTEEYDWDFVSKTGLKYRIALIINSEDDNNVVITIEMQVLADKHLTLFQVKIGMGSIHERSPHPEIEGIITTCQELYKKYQ